MMSNKTLIYIAGPTGIGKTKLSIDLAKKNLDWVPKIPLEKGLFKTIKYFKKII